MVRRSSLIIAASLAVLSTFEPGAFCFAAAAPAAEPRAGDVDRFERPRFLKREIKRYVFANTTTPAVVPETTTHEVPTPIEPHTTTSPPAETSKTPEEIAASSSTASLASAKASWASDHPGVEFGSSIPPSAVPEQTTPSTTPPTKSPTSALENSPTTPTIGQSTTLAGQAGNSPSSQAGQSPTIPVVGGGPPKDTTHPTSLLPGPSSGGDTKNPQSPASSGVDQSIPSSGGQGDGGKTTTGGNGVPQTSVPAGGSPSVSLPAGASPGSSVPATVPATPTNNPGTHSTDLPGQSSVPSLPLGGSQTPVHSVSILPSESLLNALTSALATGQPSETLGTPPPSAPTLGASVNPGSVSVPSIPASVVSNGQTIANPSFTNQPGGTPTPTQPAASTTLPNGSVVPVSEPTSSPTSGAVVLPGQSSLPGSQISASGSQSEGSQSSGAPVIVGSSTLPDGHVVPITSGQSVSQPSASQQSVSQPSDTLRPAIASASQGSLSSGVGASEGSQLAASASPTSQSPAIAGQPTAIPNSTPPAATTPDVAASPPTSLLPIATASQSYNTEQSGPLTQKPTGYDSMTAQAVPSSILLMPSSSAPTASSDYGPTGLPTGVPLVLYPPTGPVEKPENTDLIQIGFLYPLNYDFVWTHDESQRQIFKYLPIGIAYGLDIETANVTMQTLRAWDTTQDLHYITTLALAWIPSKLVDSLGLILHTKAEKFYHNPDPAVRTLLSMINPALPIRADNATDGGTNTAFGASPSGTGSTDNGAPIGNGINNSSPVKASSVGIGVGVVCGAAAYGAAMFFVARRYKKRRQSHMRSPSMYSGSPVMSHTGPDPAAGAALMSGGMGERSVSPYYDNDRGPSRGSGRSGSSAGRQQISAPVMAENSLGWN